jgi:hypothetical protein
MLNRIPYIFIAITLLFSSGCSWLYKAKDTTPLLLKVEDASREQLINEINRFAKVNSMNAKMDLKLEDTSYAQKGSKISYTAVNGTVVVQRPANIFLKVDFASFDIAQMTSNGEKFRMALLKGGSCGDKCKRFIVGSNNADYSKLENQLKNSESADTKDVGSFANLRPQHFTDAVLVRTIDDANTYLQSTIYQIEEDETQKKNSPLRKVVRGYYLFDEYAKNNSGDLTILRRFWFDRVGGIRLARQQIFDTKGEIESDIIYGKEGNLTNTGEYKNLPLRIMVTRPKDKYTMSLTYQSPESVSIGKVYRDDVFVLKNTWNLPELDLDQKLNEANGKQVLTNNQ